VAKSLGRNVSAAVGKDDLFKFMEAGADGEKLLQLESANNENDFCAAMFEDVGHAVRRFVEVNGDGDGAGTIDGEVSGMPLRTVGGKEADAVAGLHAKFDEGGGRA